MKVHSNTVCEASRYMIYKYESPNISQHKSKITWIQFGETLL